MYLFYFSSVYSSYEDVEADFIANKLHPSDLKPALAQAINDLIKPVRDHFTNDENAKKLLEKVRSWRPTK